MNELALFTGVGGGLLASALLGWKTVCAVESDWYSRCCLIQRQNDGLLNLFPIWDDVRTFDGRPYLGNIDIVSGGFPCQAFSTAAAGRNNAEDLWPEMRRIVSEVLPKYVFAENVSKKAIDKAADDCEALGYETSCISLSASDLGADHVRRRYWLLAYTDDKSKLLRGFHAEMAVGKGFQNGVWESEPDGSRMVDGVAYRVERYKATGNGQVPIVAVAALHALAYSD